MSFNPHQIGFICSAFSQQMRAGSEHDVPAYLRRRVRSSVICRGEKKMIRTFKPYWIKLFLAVRSGSWVLLWRIKVSQIEPFFLWFLFQLFLNQIEQWIGIIRPINFFIYEGAYFEAGLIFILYEFMNCYEYECKLWYFHIIMSAPF